MGFKSIQWFIQDFVMDQREINGGQAMETTENFEQSLITRDEDPENLQTAAPPKISLLTATFSMMAGALDTGLFNLPLRVTQIGLGVFTVYLLFSALFCYLSTQMLTKISLSLRHSSFGQISAAAFGPKFRYLSHFCLILFPWGVSICNQVISVQFLLQLGYDSLHLDLYTNRNQQKYNTTGTWARITMQLIIIATSFLFIVRKDLRVIQQVIKIGVLIVLLNTLIIVILFCTGFTSEVKPYLAYAGLLHVDWSNVVWVKYSGWQSLSLHLQALSSILYCFVNHQLVFIMIRTLRTPTTKRLKITFGLSIAIETLLYFLVGISGYLLLLEHEDVLRIRPLVLANITAWPMTLGKSLMVVTLYFSIPLSIFPARMVCFEAFHIEKSTKNYVILSALLAGVSCLVAIVFQNVNSYFGLLGGTAGVMMAGGIPVLCYVKLIILSSKGERTVINCLESAFSAFITLSAFVGGILSVADRNLHP